ncbi:MAG TPA: Holliday junction branch migration protein RuvA [Vicinamibacteria bacterium]|nr:Holliday junction branch migration protein RuvA [Vicinamibacteria bacterium]
MIGFLRGVLLHKTPQELILDVGGVGYRVLVPISTFCRLGDQGAQAQLLIHTHVREDQLVLYGFATPAELELFEKLISVSGVGPKVALGVLSGIEAEDLVQAIRGNDVARLTRVPGVGKKTAERLILELKDKIAGLHGGTAEPQAPSPKRTDLTSALANLGYSAAEADRAATEVLRLHPDASLGDLLRDALRVISRR